MVSSISHIRIKLGDIEVAEKVYKNDPVLKNIDSIIEQIKNEGEPTGQRKIPSREEILNTHLAFIKVTLLH